MYINSVSISHYTDADPKPTRNTATTTTLAMRKSYPVKK